MMIRDFLMTTLAGRSEILLELHGREVAAEGFIQNSEKANIPTSHREMQSSSSP